MQTSKSKTSSHKSVRKFSKLKECPYCKSELTETEREFFPCSCTFQACVDCYKDIMRNKGVCPSCRTHLKLERLNALHASKMGELSKTEIDTLQVKKAEKKNTTTITVVTTVSTKGQSRNDQINVSTYHHDEGVKHSLTKMNFTDLSKLRVIQKNMVYVIGLAPQIAKADTLEKFEYFGQYGKVTKTIVNKSNVYNAHGPGGPSYSAYVTFSNEVEASTAILAVDEFVLFDRIIRASYGTTKYCTYFLREKSCPNTGCLYLHTAAKERDCFVKDETVSNKDIFNDQQRLALEHIQKHYQEVLKKMNLNNKTKPVLPPIKTIQDKIQEFIEENEREKVALKANEVERTPEKNLELSKQSSNRKENEKSSGEKLEEILTTPQKDSENKKEESQDKENTQQKMQIDVDNEQPFVEEEKKCSEISSPPIDREDFLIKSEAKNEPNCQSYRSFSSTQSTTVNSIKKEASSEQKEETDSRLSIKSPASIHKETDSNDKQEDMVVEDQPISEEVKGDINLLDLLEKIDAKDSAGKEISDFNRRILDHLLKNLRVNSNSRFIIAQGDDKEDEETKPTESNVDEWETKNEEFNLISKSIQEYLLSPASCLPNGLNVQTDNVQSHLTSEESSIFAPSNYSTESYPNFSTPTKKSTSGVNSNCKYIEANDMDSMNTPTYNNLGERNISQEDNQNKGNRRAGKSKANKKQDKSGTKTVDSPNYTNLEKTGFYRDTSYENRNSPLRGNSKNIGNYFGNISINSAEAFYISTNNTYNLAESAL